MKTLKEITDRTKIIAHRGCWGREFPENSMPAFEKAISKNYGIELDVHLTSDGSIIIFHDHTLKRMCGKSGRIEELTEKEITSCALKRTEWHIPTFKQLLEANMNKVPLYVELKCADNGIKLADALLEAVKDYDGEIVFIGFDHPTIKYLQTFGYPVCASSIFLMKPPTDDFMPDGMLTNISFVPIFNFLRKKYPPFVPWTVSTPYQMWKAKRFCPAAIYNTKDFKSLR